MNYTKLNEEQLKSNNGGWIPQAAAAAGVLYANRKNMAKGFKDGIKEEDGFERL